MDEQQLNEQTNSEITEVSESAADAPLIVEENPKKEKKKKSKLRNILEWIATGIFGVLFVISGIGQIDGMVNRNKHYGQMIRFGYGSFLVETSSMDPVYKKDAAIITYLENADKIYERFNEYQTWNTNQTDEK